MKGVPVFRLKGYFNALRGDTINELANQLLKKENTTFVMDFTQPENTH